MIVSDDRRPTEVDSVRNPIGFSTAHHQSLGLQRGKPGKKEFYTCTGTSDGDTRQEARRGHHLTTELTTAQSCGRRVGRQSTRYRRSTKVRTEMAAQPVDVSKLTSEDKEKMYTAATTVRAIELRSPTSC